MRRTSLRQLVLLLAFLLAIAAIPDSLAAKDLTFDNTATLTIDETNCVIKSVATSGDYLVASYYSNYGSIKNVAVFKNTAPGVWTRTDTLSPPNLQVPAPLAIIHDENGYSLAIGCQNTVVIYRQSGDASFSEQTQIALDSPKEIISLAMSDSTLVVTYKISDPCFEAYTGFVIYEKSPSGEWSARLEKSYENPQQLSATSISLQNGKVAVGAPGICGTNWCDCIGDDIDGTRCCVPFHTPTLPIAFLTLNPLDATWAETSSIPTRHPFETEYGDNSEFGLHTKLSGSTLLTASGRQYISFYNIDNNGTASCTSELYVSLRHISGIDMLNDKYALAYGPGWFSFFTKDDGTDNYYSTIYLSEQIPIVTSNNNVAAIGKSAYSIFIAAVSSTNTITVIYDNIRQNPALLPSIDLLLNQ